MNLKEKHESSKKYAISLLIIFFRVLAIKITFFHTTAGANCYNELHLLKNKRNLESNSFPVFFIAMVHRRRNFILNLRVA